MNKKELCSQCARHYKDCGYYDADTNSCENYVYPYDNHKMFRNIFSTKGRIGRLEYFLMIIACSFLWLILLLVSGYVWSHYIGIPKYWDSDYLTDWLEIMFPFALPCYLLVVAGIKRTKDDRIARWFAFTPIIFLFYFNIYTLVITCASVFFILFFAKDEQGVNAHDSNESRTTGIRIN